MSRTITRFSLMRDGERLLVAAFVVAAAAAHSVRGQVVSTWDGTSGNWTNPALWSTNPIYPNNGNPPGTTYTAQTRGGGTLTMDTAITIQALNIAGQVTFAGGNGLTVTGSTYLQNGLPTINVPFSTGTLTLDGSSATVLGGSGAVNVSGSMTAFGRTAVQGSGSFSVGGGLSLSSTGSRFTVDGRSLILTGGTSSWSGGSIFLQNGGMLTIGSGATVNVSKTDPPFGMANGGGATPTFAVNGTFVVSSPSSNAVEPIDRGINFTNSGTIDIRTTAVAFMTLSGLANTGRVRVEAGNAWAGSITSSGAAAVVTGAGMYRELGSPFPSGALTFNGGRLAPGDPVGTMEVALPITMGPGSVFEAELGGPVPARYDQLNLTSGGSISFNGSALNVLLEYAPSPTDVFTIVFGGPVNGTFAGLADGTEFSVGRFNSTDYVGTITYTPTSIILSNIHAVPEPAAWLLAGTAAVAWTWRRRRMATSRGRTVSGDAGIRTQNQRIMSPLL